MYKGIAGKIYVEAYDTSASGAPKTGDAANITVYLAKDGGSLTALADTSATEVSSTNAKGVYSFDVTATEADADQLVFTGKSSTANIYIRPVTVYTKTSLLKRRNTAQAGAANTITLDASATAAHCAAGDMIYIESGSGAGYSNWVESFNSTSKVATMVNDWGSNPSSSSVFQVIAGGGSAPADVNDVWSDAVNPTRDITGGNVTEMNSVTVIGAGTVASPWRGG